MSDAIVRTLVRVYVTHRRLLEWVTAAQAKSGLGLDLWGFYRRMGGGARSRRCARRPSSAGGGPDVLAAAVPFLLLWMASPAVARWVSSPGLAARTAPLSAADARALRLIARRTWRFFATFVGPEDHSLPPDNFQEDPKPGRGPSDLAHEPRPLSPVDRGRARFRLDRHARRRRAAGGHARDDAAPRALPRPLLQLVRHDGPPSARSAVRVVGRQRQSRGPPHRARPRLPGDRSSGRSCLRRRSPGSRTPRSSSVSRRAPRPMAGARVRSPGSGWTRPWTPSWRRSRSVPEAAEWPGRLAGLKAHARAVTDLARGLVEDDRRSSPSEEPSEEVIVWALALHATVESHTRDLDGTSPMSEPLIQRLTSLARSAEALVRGMDFGFLFDPVRKLFAIGYRVADGSLDPGHYDLLASEARLTSFVAIAKGDVPVSHWFRLGRALTPVEQDSVLVSWSGSMFEYLMPALVMRAPAGSLLEQTCRLVVRRQITLRRGARRAVGSLGVRLQRPRPRDDLPVFELRRARPRAPAGAERRRRRRPVRDRAGGHDRSGGRGPELPASRGRRRPAAPTASTRLSTTRRPGFPEDALVAVVRAYMAHHQGMSLVALDNVLHGGIDARALSRRAPRPGHRPLAAGADAARRRGRPTACGRRDGDRRRARVRPAGRPALHHAARRAPAHASPVEWALRGDGHGRGLRATAAGAASP